MRELVQLAKNAEPRSLAYGRARCLLARMAAAREISRLEEARRSARRIVWDDGLWLVFEFVEAFDRRQAPSLVFESDTTVRRVRNYPANWRALSDDELVALSWSV